MYIYIHTYRFFGYNRLQQDMTNKIGSGLSPNTKTNGKPMINHGFWGTLFANKANCWLVVNQGYLKKNGDEWLDYNRHIYIYNYGDTSGKGACFVNGISGQQKNGERPKNMDCFQSVIAREVLGTRKSGQGIYISNTIFSPAQNRLKKQSH